jgi:hypothetical protein
VDIEVRRSERLKMINKGFKNSSCPGKNCFCSNIAPPTLSQKVIRSLGKDLCKIPPKNLSDEALKMKPLAKKSTAAKPPKAKKDDKSKCNTPKQQDIWMRYHTTYNNNT